MGRLVRRQDWLVGLMVVVLAGTLAGCQAEQGTTTDTPPPADTAAAGPADGAEGAAGPVRGTVETIGEGADAITVLNVWGSPREMGYAHGALLKTEVADFVDKIVGAMTLGMGVDAETLDQAWAAMEPFCPAEYLEELQGLAEGSGVDLMLLKRAHAIPDISEMDCTFFAAWGDFTKDGHFIQLRALDYATEAHIQDNPMITIYHPDEGLPYANIGWCGFVGMVTGMNVEGICMSEIGDDFDKDIHTLQAEPMPFVMRDVISKATTMDEGLAIVRDAKRTSSFLYLIGDAKIPAATALKTSPDTFEMITAEDTPYGPLGDAVWMSMGADSKWNAKIREALEAEEGTLTVDSAITGVTGKCETGDLHTVYFDGTAMTITVANADRDASPAYNQGFVTFDAGKAFAAEEPAGE